MVVGCPQCSLSIDCSGVSGGVACPRCGQVFTSPSPEPPPIVVRSSSRSSYVPPQRSPGIAAVLSFVWPGLGQIYNGQIGSGLFVMFVFLVCLALFPLVFPPFIGLLLWGYGIFEAHSTAERLNRRGR